jgi:DNA anti-recombination protein RmuC
MEDIKRNIKNGLYALLIAGMIGGTSACSNNKQKDTVDTSSSTNTGQAYEKGSDAETMDMDTEAGSWMRERDTYVSKHRATLDKIENDMETWKSSMDSKSSKANAAMKESMKSLKMKKDQFENSLNDMEQSSEENWTRMRSQVDEKAMELERTHEAFTKEYGKNS